MAFTGPQTKIALNQGKYKFKISHLNANLNFVMFWNVAAMLGMDLLMSQIGTRVWHTQNWAGHYYLFPEEEPAINAFSFKASLSFYLLLNGLVPLDLMVAATLAKMIYSGFLVADIGMISEEKSIEAGEIKGCTIKNIELMQDFALVNNLFCDKTGTLTQNKLVFRTLSLKGQRFTTSGSFADFKAAIEACGDKDEQFMNFWRCLCICHDVEAIEMKDSGRTEYQGISQDEVKFQEMAKDVGLVYFHSRAAATRGISVMVDGQLESYEVLKVIEFTSERKKMSVIVKRESDGRVFNFIKGADSGIMAALKEGEAAEKSETVEHVTAFAHEGLRTLVFAFKELDAAVTEGSLQDMNEEELESNLELLGVTGLEDILQENVHSCIQ